MLWSVGEKKALCGIPAALENARCLAFLNENPNVLVSGMLHFTEMSAMKLWGTQCMFCPSQMICVTRHLRSAGTSHVRIWEIDEKTKNMTSRDCKLGKLRRTCNCIVVHPDDDKVYCGTQSGTIRTKSESLRLCG